MWTRFPGSLTDVKGLRVGQVENHEAQTGVTCILCEPQATGGVSVRGSAPGTRETDLLHPCMTVEGPHAVVLAGGSAYGLAAADGVMRFLEERGIGVPVAGQVVPIVSSAILMDLGQGRGDIRPDAAMGYAACKAAQNTMEQGLVGAGRGCTVGKLVPGAKPVPGGLGTASMPLPGGGHIAALVAVNAAGDIYHPHTGELLACGLGENGQPVSFEAFLSQGVNPKQPAGNTTIAVLATDRKLSKAEVNRLAGIAHDGFARCIRPVHTLVDGDTIFGLATGQVEGEVPPILLDALAAEVMARAVANACLGDSV